MSEQIESLLESSTKLVPLNTRITKKNDTQLLYIQGWLQAASRFSKVTKQSAINWAINEAFNSLENALKRMDDQQAKLAIKSRIRASESVILAQGDAEHIMAHYGLTLEGKK